MGPRGTAVSIDSSLALRLESFLHSIRSDSGQSRHGCTKVRVDRRPRVAHLSFDGQLGVHIHPADPVREQTHYDARDDEDR